MLEFVCIVLNIFRTYISFVYFGLYKHELLRRLYIGLVTVVGTVVFQLTLDPRMDGTRAAKWRVHLFPAFVASGFIPVAHLAHLDGALAASTGFPLQSSASMVLFYAAGAAFYIARFPEKYWPGKFNLLVSERLL